MEFPDNMYACSICKLLGSLDRVTVIQKKLKPVKFYIICENLKKLVE